MGSKKDGAVRFGEREIFPDDSPTANRPTRTAASRHEALEVSDMYNKSAREMITAPVDEYGSVPLDRKNMQRMGKDQEMRRVFRQISLLSFTCIVMATWEFTLMANTQGLVCGGRAGLFWSYVWTFVGFGLLSASLAEMASMAPTAGGQYHWVSEFAPPRYQKFLSYCSGWLAVLCWQAGNASGGFLAGILIQSLISIGNPNYAEPGWQGTLLVFPVMGICIVFNVWGSKILPAMQNAIMAVHVFGFVAVIVVMWVLAPHVDARTALLDFTNEGGWDSMGLALMIGQITAVVGLASSDSAAHMSEEVRDAGLSVPRAIFWTFWINGIMGFILVTTYVFSIPSVDDAINDPSGFPMIYVFNLAMPSSGTICMIVLLLVLLMAGNISYQASTARQTWAFARDGGLPYSSWIAKVHPTLLVPVNAVLLSAFLTILLSLINIGSSAAFNAIISLASVAQMGTYCISISCVLYRRLTAPHLLPQARWNLGKWGVAINAGAIAYAWTVWFWSFWPNATWAVGGLAGFNWAPIMFVIVVTLSMTFYFIKGRKTYFGPVTVTENWQAQHGFST